MSDGWLRCRVLKGMFSDERVVVFGLSNGASSSVFVPSSRVEGEPEHEGRVQVGVFRDDRATWAVLPTEYREAFPVKDADLVETSYSPSSMGDDDEDSHD